jgi:hypothetical protein
MIFSLPERRDLFDFRFFRYFKKSLGHIPRSMYFYIDRGITFYYTFGMKTAISIPDEIFKEVKKIAEENNYSRSEVFVLAVKDYLEKLKSQKMLKALNKAYSDVKMESREEKTLRETSKKYYARKVLRRDLGHQTR